MVFIAGNMPMKTEIAPLLIVIKLEQYDYAGAAAVGLAMVAISFGRCWRSTPRRSSWPEGPAMSARPLDARVAPAGPGGPAGAASVAVMAALVLLPLFVVFHEALRKGVGKYLAAIRSPTRCRP